MQRAGLAQLGYHRFGLVKLPSEAELAACRVPVEGWQRGPPQAVKLRREQKAHLPPQGRRFCGGKLATRVGARRPAATSARGHIMFRPRQWPRPGFRAAGG